MSAQFYTESQQMPLQVDSARLRNHQVPPLTPDQIEAIWQQFPELQQTNNYQAELPEYQAVSVR